MHETTGTTSHHASGARSPDAFDLFAAQVAQRVAAAKGKPLFYVEQPTPLFDVYLGAFADPTERQVLNCHGCRTFLNRFGGVVTIGEDGSVQPLAWPVSNEFPGAYHRAAELLHGAVARAPIAGVFYSSEPTWGTGKSAEGWSHFFTASPAVFKHALQSAGQAAAEKREEYAMLRRSLAEFPIDVVRRAVALLKDGQLERSEKVLGPAEWLLRLHEAMGATKNERARDNLVWAAVAAAPAGFCHVRSGMIGTLLEDLATGAPFEKVKRRFDEKMHPLQYLRPQAAPSDGNIAQAEAIVAKLRTAGALDRRFAKIKDVQAHWKPWPRSEEKKDGGGGVFGHLRAEAKQKLPADTGAPPRTMTWVKFAAEVLPGAEQIEALVPQGPGAFAALVTAVDPAAPPMLQWDRDDKRNPVSWYFYVNGSYAAQWNLRAGEHVAVTAIALSPAKWDAEHPRPNERNILFFLLDGARDTKHTAGGGLFVENLRSDYHPVRRTLEAHFRSAPIAGRDEATACGLALDDNSKTPVTLRVTANGVRSSYRIDRWD